MYCQSCGKEIYDNFCPNCNTKQKKAKKYTSINWISASAWLILFIVFSTVQLYGNYERNFGYCFLVASICTIFITAIMIFFPLLLWVLNKKPFDHNTGKKICIINSIALFIISCISLVAFEIDFIGGMGAIIYYFINMALFSEPNIVRIKIPKSTGFEDRYIYNPCLTKEDNLKARFSEMDIEVLKDLINNKKDEYTEEAYNIALQQYDLRKNEIVQNDSQEKIQQDVDSLDKNLIQLTQMLEQAKKDLGNLTIEDAENMYRRKLISSTQKEEMISSIKEIQTIIETAPYNIEVIKKAKEELEEKLKETT